MRRLCKPRIWIFKDICLCDACKIHLNGSLLGTRVHKWLVLSDTLLQAVTDYSSSDLIFLASRHNPLCCFIPNIHLNVVCVCTWVCMCMCVCVLHLTGLWPPCPCFAGTPGTPWGPDSWLIAFCLLCSHWSITQICVCVCVCVTAHMWPPQKAPARCRSTEVLSLCRAFD